MTCPEAAPAWLSLGIVTAASLRSPVLTVVSRMSAEVTAPSRIFAEVIASSFTSAVATVVSRMSAEVTLPSTMLLDATALTAMVGFGYVPVRPPPAGPPGGTPLMATLPALVSRPLASTAN